MILAILIPVYNEERLLERSFARLADSPPPTDPFGNPVTRRFFLVNDGSNDLTSTPLAAIAQRPDTTVLHHASNRGKGAAIRTALEAALAYRDESGNAAELFLIHDADLEYDPADHKPLLAPILDGRADAVIGSRFLGTTHRVLYYWHYLANLFITTFSNICTNLNLSDIECCFKAFSRPVAEQIKIEEDRFGIEPELVAKLAAVRLHEQPPTVEGRPPPPPIERSIRVYEVAVSYAGRTYAEGKKITWQDGFSALRCIVLYNLMR